MVFYRSLSTELFPMSMYIVYDGVMQQNYMYTGRPMSRGPRPSEEKVKSALF